MFVTPIITEDREDQAAQSCPHPSLVPALGRTGPASHELQHMGDQTLHLAWAAQ